jgi:transposase
VKIEGTKRGKRFARTNVVAARSGSNTVAPLCYTQNTNGEFFTEWFRKRLVKAIAKGSTVIMDNASFHPKKKLRNLARRHGVKLLFLPPYSPDLNPIEKTWANMKRALVDILPNCKTLSDAIYTYFSISNS